MRKDVSDATAKKWLWTIIIVAGILSLVGLGNRPFWGDEVHLINIGERITEYGLPIIDNSTRQIEVTYGLDDTNPNAKVYNENVDYGVPISDDRKDLVVYTLHPWLTMYIIAVPIKIMKMAGIYEYNIKVVKEERVEPRS
jgi:hypothetical protein